jgi:methionyl-tRNA formyltransferase
VLALRALRRRSEGLGLPGTAEVFGATEARVITTTDPYGPETAEAIARLEPDMLLLVGGFGIVREPLLSLCPNGVVSYHHGDMRRYRGLPAGFWELYNGERRMGVTVQRLTAGIDCGQPITERHFEIRPDDTLASLSRRIYDGSFDMLLEAVELVEEGRVGPPLETLGPVYTLPNLRQWLTFQFRVAARVTRERARSFITGRS